MPIHEPPRSPNSAGLRALSYKAREEKLPLKGLLYNFHLQSTPSPVGEGWDEGTNAARFPALVSLLEAPAI